MHDHRGASVTPDTFKIRMTPCTEDRPDRHPTLRSSATGDTVFCAHSHCRGACGLPALFLEGDIKAHGEMVACGPVWQQKPWDGERVYLPAEFRTDRIRNFYWP